MNAMVFELRRALGALLLGVAMALAGLGYGGLIHAHAERPINSDFFSLYGSAQRLRAGISPYWDSTAMRAPGQPCHRSSQAMLDQLNLPPQQRDLQLELLCRSSNLNPPIFSVLLLPLTDLSMASVQWVWAGLSLAACVWGVVLIWRTLPETRRVMASKGALPLTAFLVAFHWWFPTWACHLYGQVTLVLFLPMVLSWRAMRQGQAWRAGAWLGLLMGLKLFFGLFLLTLVAARRWRELAMAAAVATGCVLMGWLAVGWQGYVDYFHGLRHVDWVAASMNGSLQGYFSRFLGGSNNQPWINAPGWARLLTVVACLLVVGVLLATVRRLADGPTGHRQGGERGVVASADGVFALTLPAMLLVSPLGWLYYFSWMVLPGLIVWNWRLHSLHPERTTRLLLMLAVMVAAPRAFLGASQVNAPVSWVLDWGFYTYALLGLFALAAWRARQWRHASAAPGALYNPSHGICSPALPHRVFRR